MVNPLVLATAHAAKGRETALAGLRRLCFWGSVLLPMSYLPILYGMNGSTQLQAVAAIVTVHVLCLLISRDYSR